MENYVKGQLWLKKEAEIMTIALSKQGQEDLGGITFITLPKVGDKLQVDDPIADVEAEKAVTELLTPIAGEVVAINEEAMDDTTLLDNPEEGSAWLVKLKEIPEN